MEWNKENLFKEALSYKTRKDFKKENNLAYQACVRRGILDYVCGHMMPLLHAPYTNEDIRQIALKFKTKKEFSKMEGSAYSIAAKRGILKSICSHMMEIRHSWTYWELQHEAYKFKTRGEFRKNSSAYSVALRRNILDKICSHMLGRIDAFKEKESNFKWTTKTLQEEALKYKTRGEFAEKSAAYNTAHRRGLIDKICRHMKFSNGISNPERELSNIIKNMGYKPHKFRDSKIKIEGKSHIKGFEIDLFFSDINKGIEFDGIYWHSFEGLKKSRPNWPDEDLKKYHEIKDSYFVSKGIQILHIKEEDWIKDKEACIKKCLEFLGN